MSAKMDKLIVIVLTMLILLAALAILFVLWPFFLMLASIGFILFIAKRAKYFRQLVACLVKRRRTRNVMSSGDSREGSRRYSLAKT